MSFKSAFPAILAVAALGVSGPAAAALVTISGSGVWVDSAPPTAYSAPDMSFSYSFQLPATYSPGNDAPIPGTPDTTGPDVGISTDFTNFSYTLGVNPVVGVPDDIIFFSLAYGGGFALGFPDYTVEFYGPVDIGSKGTITLGTYSLHPYIVAQNGTYAPVDQGAVPKVTSVVPEPAAWSIMLVGFGLAGGAVRGGRRARMSQAG